MIEETGNRLRKMRKVMSFGMERMGKGRHLMIFFVRKVADEEVYRKEADVIRKSKRGEGES